MLIGSLVELWRGSVVGAKTLAICDFGSGFGDLVLGVLSRLQVAGDVDVTVDLVDRDLTLAESARLSLKGELGVRARSSTPDQLFSGDARYDLILASHVLYYVEDRSRVIGCLLNRLSERGSACFVLRSEHCDTFKIRSAVRSAEYCPRYASLPRVTPATVAEVIEAQGFSPLIRELELEVAMSIDDLSLTEALSCGPASSVAEVIRLLAHVPPAEEVPGAVRRCLEDEFRDRRDGALLRLTLADTIITAQAI